MKKWFILFGIIILLFVGGYLVLSLYAVKFIQSQLRKVIGPGFTIAEIKVKTTHLSIKGIRFEDMESKKRFLQVEEMKVYPDLFSLFRKTLQVREWMIIQPSFLFYRSREGDILGPWPPIKKEEKGKEVSVKEEKKEGEPFQIKIERFRILKGSLDFEDMKAGETPVQIRLRDLDLDIRNIQYPVVSIQSPIVLKGKLKGKMKEGEIHSKGWIDLKTVDLETSLKVQEVELKTFEPYYHKRVSAEIESGYMNMDANITIKRKMINAPGTLEIMDLRIKEGGTVFYIPAKTLIAYLKGQGNQMKVQFNVKGNLDDPQFKLEETFLTRIAISLAENLGIPIKVIGETLFEGSGKGSEGWIEGLKSIEELFRRKEKKR